MPKDFSDNQFSVNTEIAQDGETKNPSSQSCELPVNQGRDFVNPSAKRGLKLTAEVRSATDHYYETLKHVLPRFEWDAYAPIVHAINEMKKDCDAVILAHNYMTPEIFACVGDFTGDSLALAKQAAGTDAKTIVQAGVHFMAETSKILAPEKKVLIPDLRAGCSLASSITAEDVKLIKSKYPGVPVVTYVNTSAAVKAECDICCTSSNAVQVVEHAAREWGTQKVILVPDQYLAKNVAAQTSLEIITWDGACEVHEQFTAQDIRDLRDGHPSAIILAHPECPPDVVAEADFAGSTGAMSNYVKEKQPAKVVMITECSMSDNVSIENPKIDFVKPCNLCPHMKQIDLGDIYDSLLFSQHEVEVDELTRQKALRSVERMVSLKMTTAGQTDFDVNAMAPEIEVLKRA